MWGFSPCSSLRAVRRDALPTKRGRDHLTVIVKQPKNRQGEAVEITIDDVDQFKRVRELDKGKQKPLSPLPESRFKRGPRSRSEDCDTRKMG
jgi:hypothetical protein